MYQSRQLNSGQRRHSARKANSSFLTLAFRLWWEHNATLINLLWIVVEMLSACSTSCQLMQVKWKTTSREVTTTWTRKFLRSWMNAKSELPNKKPKYSMLRTILSPWCRKTKNTWKWRSKRSGMKHWQCVTKSSESSQRKTVRSIHS